MNWAFLFSLHGKNSHFSIFQLYSVPTNIEIKASCTNRKNIENLLTKGKADFKGIDHQIDTYFVVPNGRLKLREGNIENHLIHYHRADQKGPKQSLVTLFKTEPDSSLKQLLTDALGIKTVVDKQRAIYFIDNVKFHLDEVKGLGQFVEIEAIDKDGSIPVVQLQEQCEYYIRLFGIKPADLLTTSYSDMIKGL